MKKQKYKLIRGTLVVLGLTALLANGILPTQGHGRLGPDFSGLATHASQVSNVSSIRNQHRRRYKKSRRRQSYRRPSTLPSDGRVTNGSWGGDHIVLTVTSEGGTFEIDCAHGSINEPMLTDAKGRFDVRGNYVREGGPDMQQENRDNHPARFTGWTNGKQLSFTIRLTDTNQPMGEFNLTLGQEPRMTKCL